MDKKIIEFLRESNHIEGEYSELALHDACKAWEFAYKNRKKINIGYVLKIHKFLMQNLRPDIAGKLRICDVWIGGRHCKYHSIRKLKNELLEYLDEYHSDISEFKKKEISFELLTKQAHIQFEKIHPFEDGNGRTGRILWAIHRLNLGLPIHIIHSGYEQKEYYKWFK